MSEKIINKFPLGAETRTVYGREERSRFSRL